MEDRRVCTRCVLAESPPDITLDASGVCNVCRAHTTHTASGQHNPGPQESEFTQILAKHRGKHEYDCVVMCSGGKDSTAALYYMVKRYKAKVLAFMFDNGFETEDAINNVKRAVDALKVDFIFYKSTFMHDLFAKLITTDSKAVVCHLCSIWYMDTTFKLAARYDIPIIIAGWTKGQSTKQGSSAMSKCACTIYAPEYKQMGQATKDFLATHLKADPKYKDFPASMEEVIERAKKRHKSTVLSPHWFLPDDANVYVELIKKELGWEYPTLSYPARSTNCKMNFVTVNNSFKNFGYTHYHVEMSKLIREGIMTRDEALAHLKPNFDQNLLNEITSQLGVIVPLGIKQS